MTFEEFVREEELNERRRQQEKREREAKAEAQKKAIVTQGVEVADKKRLADERKAAQRAQLERIMDEATKRYAEGKKKDYDLGKPLAFPEAWLVFDRATGELYGEATAMRAHQAWLEVKPTRMVEGVPEAIGFNACRCVLRSEWEKAEEKFRKSKMNGKSNGAKT